MPLTRSKYGRLFTAYTLAAIAQIISASSFAQDLTVLTWEDYIEPAVVEAFEAKFNAKVKFIYYGDDDERDVMLAHSGGLGYDLICVDEAAVNSYIANDWVQKINTEKIANHHYLSLKPISTDETWRAYAVPYFWGTMGIIYRSDLVSKPLTRWKDLYAPSPELAGKIIMLETTQVLVGMGLKANGRALTDTSAEAFWEVEKLLVAQKPFVAAYRNIHMDERSWLVSGKAVAAMAYNGDALVVMELHPELVYTHPAEGGTLWIDFWMLSKSSQNEPLALRFLNFINNPNVAAKNAEYVNYATPNKEAEKYLPKEFLENESIYPSKEYLSSSQIFPSWTPRLMKRATNIIMRVIR